MTDDRISDWINALNWGSADWANASDDEPDIIRSKDVTAGLSKTYRFDKNHPAYQEVRAEIIQEERVRLASFLLNAITEHGWRYQPLIDTMLEYLNSPMAPPPKAMGTESGSAPPEPDTTNDTDTTT